MGGCRQTYFTCPTSRVFTHTKLFYTHTKCFVCVQNSFNTQTIIVLYTYTMVKHTKCFLYEPDNFVNIKGFVGVKVVHCMCSAGPGVTGDICLGGWCLGGAWCLGLVVMTLAALWSEHMPGACAGGQFCVGFVMSEDVFWNDNTTRILKCLCVIQGCYMSEIGPCKGQKGLSAGRLLNKHIC